MKYIFAKIEINASVSILQLQDIFKESRADRAQVAPASGKLYPEFSMQRERERSLI